MPHALHTNMCLLPPLGKKLNETLTCVRHLASYALPPPSQFHVLSHGIRSGDSCGPLPLLLPSFSFPTSRDEAATASRVQGEIYFRLITSYFQGEARCSEHLENLNSSIRRRSYSLFVSVRLPPVGGYYLRAAFIRAWGSRWIAMSAE